MNDLDRAVEAAGALEGESRRSMYTFIRGRGKPVSRDEAAAAVGISSKLAAFHLDKLVEKGLLKASYARLGDRRGPGAGRPSKLYEPSEVEVELSIPPRKYQWIGSILLDAVAAARPGEAAIDSAKRIAHESGRASGATPLKERGSNGVEAQLADRGYEPLVDEDGRIVMRNCPFHELAQRSTEVVCGINHAFLEGFVEGADVDRYQAVLEPAQGRCCVVLEPKEGE